MTEDEADWEGVAVGVIANELERDGALVPEADVEGDDVFEGVDVDEMDAVAVAVDVGDPVGEGVPAAFANHVFSGTAETPRKRVPDAGVATT